MTTRFATSPDSTRIASDVTGAGTSLILLLHGGGGSRAEWHEGGYVARLRDEFTVIAVDLRGHGENDRPTDPAFYTTEKKGQDILAVIDAAISTVQVRLFEGMTHEQEFEDVEQVLPVILEFIES